MNTPYEGTIDVSPGTIRSSAIYCHCGKVHKDGVSCPPRTEPTLDELKKQLEVARWRVEYLEKQCALLKELVAAHEEHMRVLLGGG